ncbi:MULTISPECIES: DUF2145 domain-containing protein [Xanthomonas]|uniref:DUF2145 domain-containing protein n=1 Tax=Xanthomonas TaxID=338 RepID=UPI001AD98321|nr:DUF2145 domain-containing protein [Xanthomonas phaseoli]MBO9768975.1 DUF2145 domain-containing protein [Xanthomonas phaseoli pv. dieffenbachiae]MBO9774363.1 DUF2145 domain-containing protein [Xanthomonas phaseoli pv. dieffenbachiae]MBO9780454.1 DUF2145 domain-containing protein [Xanthomonas phaseoli pv. dieffenbachiae]MBO9795757.1 DUF2145 domain-containing protein [Xanthomonas phaseoli pv. dieffenbachiae]MBO9798918.1 DUF2145 domain-containing protein [Xanthomonas phaseoli pv. dieffenbachiae
MTGTIKARWIRQTRRKAIALLVLATLPLSATATTPRCVPRYPTPQATAAMFDMATSTAQALDALPDAKVVLLARGGQDLSRYGLKHSHLAFAVRDDDGIWRVRHLLNRCKSDASQLYVEGLSNFVGESAVSHDLRVGVLTPAIQQRLRALLSDSGELAHRLHETRYSMVAYPFSTDYQNSNQWVLEVLAAALAADAQPPTVIGDRRASQAWLQAARYHPSILHLDLKQRVGARFVAANATTTDHPVGERVSGNHSVVTVESVFNFLHQRDALAQELSIPHATATPGATP